MTKRAIILAGIGILLISGIWAWNTWKVEPEIEVFVDGEQSVEWPVERLPLSVWCESSVDDCVAAALLWNVAVKCELFSMAEHGPDGADVRIMTASANDPLRDGAIEKTFVSKTGTKINYVEILNYEPAFSFRSAYSMQYAVNSHALSHALGLSHTRTGITRARQSPDDPPPRALHKHARFLRERYCL